MSLAVNSHVPSFIVSSRLGETALFFLSVSYVCPEP
eukprot:COSAG06_NODE_36319_length_448_cov_1.538682_1_plen_35_part_10